jgi:hypothetical protein
MNRIQVQSGLSMPEFFLKAQLPAKRPPFPGFSLKTGTRSGRSCLAPVSTAFSDVLPCFVAVSLAGFENRPTVVAGRKPKNPSEFRWVNTVLDNLNTRLKLADYAFDVHKYGTRYLGTFAYRLNRRFAPRRLHQRLLVGATLSGPQPQRSIRLTGVHC